MGKKSEARGRAGAMAGAMAAQGQPLVGFGGSPLSGHVDDKVSGPAQLALKGISKKDPLTRLKALHELISIIPSMEEEECLALLDHWPRIYTRVSCDNDRRIREAVHLVLGTLVPKVGKHLRVSLKSLMPFWLLGQYDPAKEVSLAATNAFVSAFTTTKKCDSALLFCKSELLTFLKAATTTTSSIINIETEEGRSQAERQLLCSLLSLNRLISTMASVNDVDILALLSSSKLWKHYKMCENSRIRIAVCEMAVTVLLAIPEEKDVPDFDEAQDLRTKILTILAPVVCSFLQETSVAIHGFMWNAILTLFRRFPTTSWKHIDGVKAVVSKLCAFLSAGCYDCAASYKAILPLLTLIPTDVVNASVKKEQSRYRSKIEASHKGVPKHIEPLSLFPYHALLFKSMREGLLKLSDPVILSMCDSYFECLLYYTSYCYRDTDEVNLSGFPSYILGTELPALLNVLLDRNGLLGFFTDVVLFLQKDKNLVERHNDAYVLWWSVLGNIISDVLMNHQSICSVLDNLGIGIASMADNSFVMGDVNSKGLRTVVLDSLKCCLSVIHCTEDDARCRSQMSFILHLITSFGVGDCSWIFHFLVPNSTTGSPTLFLCEVLVPLLETWLNDSTVLPATVGVLLHVCSSVRTCGAGDTAWAAVFEVLMKNAIPLQAEVIAEFAVEIAKTNDTAMTREYLGSMFSLATGDWLSSANEHNVDGVKKLAVATVDMTSSPNLIPFLSLLSTLTLRTFPSYECEILDVITLIAVRLLPRSCSNSEFNSYEILLTGVAYLALRGCSAGKLAFHEWAKVAEHSGYDIPVNIMRGIIATEAAFTDDRGSLLEFVDKVSTPLLKSVVEQSPDMLEIIIPLVLFPIEDWRPKLAAPSKTGLYFAAVSNLRIPLLKEQSQVDVGEVTMVPTYVSATCRLICNILLDQESDIVSKTMVEFLSSHADVALGLVRFLCVMLQNSGSSVSNFLGVGVEPHISSLSASDQDAINETRLALSSVIHSCRKGNGDSLAESLVVQAAHHAATGYTEDCNVLLLLIWGVVVTGQSMSSIVNLIERDTDPEVWCTVLDGLLSVSEHPGMAEKDLFQSSLPLSTAIHSITTVTSADLMEGCTAGLEATKWLNVIARVLSLADDSAWSCDGEMMAVASQLLLHIRSNWYTEGSRLCSTTSACPIAAATHISSCRLLAVFIRRGAIYVNNVMELFEFAFERAGHTLRLGNSPYFRDVDPVNAAVVLRAGIEVLRSCWSILSSCTDANGSIGAFCISNKSLVERWEEFRIVAFEVLLPLFCNGLSAVNSHSWFIPVFYSLACVFSAVPDKILFDHRPTTELIDLVSLKDNVSIFPPHIVAEIQASSLIVLRRLVLEDAHLQSLSYDQQQQVSSNETTDDDDDNNNNVSNDELAPSSLMQGLLDCAKSIAGIVGNNGGISRVAGLLGIWQLILDHTKTVCQPLRAALCTLLRDNDSMRPLFDVFVSMMPFEECISNSDYASSLRTCVSAGYIEAIKGYSLAVHELSTSLHTDALMAMDDGPTERIGVLAVIVYASALHTFPAIIRRFSDSSNRNFQSQLESFTGSVVTPSLIDDELKASQNHLRSSEHLSIRVRPVAREVLATYHFEDISVELIVRLALAHPLKSVEVTSGPSVGVSDVQWRKWLMQLTMFVTHQNGSVASALHAWAGNLDRRFSGVEECSVCYSTLHATNLSLPKPRCRTCKKKFHSICLYKWFQSSGKSTCPMCRSAF